MQPVAAANSAKLGGFPACAPRAYKYLQVLPLFRKEEGFFCVCFGGEVPGGVPIVKCGGFGLRGLCSPLRNGVECGMMRVFECCCKNTLPDRGVSLMMKRRIAGLLLLIMLMTAVLPAGAEEAAAADVPGNRLPDDVLLSYYENSIFFGDSIMNGLRRYRSNIRQTDEDFMEGVTVLATTSISLYHASRRFSNENGTFLHRGARKNMYDITKDLKPDKIFILLGLNDEVGLKIEKAITWVEYILEHMPEYAPDTEIYFFSQTPVTPFYCRKRECPDYPAQVDQYNRRLQEVCEQNGAHYIEIAAPLKNEENYLDPLYTIDGDCHLNDDGTKIWIQCLCDYAQAQYDQGLWTPANAEKGE